MKVISTISAGMVLVRVRQLNYILYKATPLFKLLMWRIKVNANTLISFVLMIKINNEDSSELDKSSILLREPTKTHPSPKNSHFVTNSNICKNSKKSHKNAPFYYDKVKFRVSNKILQPSLVSASSFGQTT